MNGIVRTLTTDVVANNIVENLLKPLDADLFMFVNPTQKGDVNDKTMASFPNAEFKVITLEQVMFAIGILLLFLVFTFVGSRCSKN